MSGGEEPLPALMSWQPVASPSARPAASHFLSILVPSRNVPPLSHAACTFSMPLTCAPSYLLSSQPGTVLHEPQTHSLSSTGPGGRPFVLTKLLMGLGPHE